ncbi:exported hypothetical protein [Hyphomicrobiales bacterium]|nr:exported hypothetical protein [Hyphomicrobiales bacterium]CAH1697831.1 exported hypothetical protein [Hyphomicrobiales bacterium]CAI0347477.1 exported hypothetical protein [Hyphomicrobiales bacterium]
MAKALLSRAASLAAALYAVSLGAGCQYLRGYDQRRPEVRTNPITNRNATVPDVFVPSVTRSGSFY